MNILVATGLYPPATGGPATHTKIIERELPKHDFNIKVVSFTDFIKLPKIIRHISYAFKLLRESKGKDLIYALDPVSVGVPACIASKLVGKKLVLRLGGDYAWEQSVNRFGYKKTLDDFVIDQRLKFRSKFLQKIQKSVAKNSEVVIVPSQYLKTVVEKWGIESEKIKVIYNTFDAVNIPSQSKEEIRKELDLSGKIILSAGRLVSWKGFDGLIEVVSKLDFEYKLVIAGDGLDKKSLELRAKSEELDNRIRFTGNLEKKWLYKYIKAADVFVLNTSYEGLSHLLLEVMSIGTPIVTTNIGGNTELFNDGVEGLLSKSNNTEAIKNNIIRLLEDRGLRDKVVGGAKTKAKSFSKNNMIENLVKEFKKIA